MRSLSRFVATFLVAILCLTVGCERRPVVRPHGVAGVNAAKPGKWTWVPIDGMQCRDGSATGIGIRRQTSSKNLILYLNGGGACFSPETCRFTPPHFTAADFSKTARILNHIFVFSGKTSPFARWNQVFVPYCTGDLHGGTAHDASVPDCPTCPKQQQFVGYDNVSKLLGVLAQTFPQGKVVLSGSSAGGFGTLLNYAQTRKAFGRRPIVIDDSGPVYPQQNAFPPCLDDHWVKTWHLDAILPHDCTECAKKGQRLQALMPWIGKQQGDVPHVYLGSRSDKVIRAFMSNGAQHCGAGDVTSMDIHDANDAYPKWLGASGWKTFIVEGRSHMQLIANRSVGDTHVGAFLTTLSH